MSTTRRCGGSRQAEYPNGIGGTYHAPCPGCEDCRDRKDVPDPTATRANDAPALSPVEALARRLEALGAELTLDIAGMPRDAAAMLRTLDRECDRLRETLAECALTAGRANRRNDVDPNRAMACYALGVVTGLARMTLATDARTVDRG